jgi:hypothetical protein
LKKQGNASNKMSFEDFAVFLQKPFKSTMFNVFGKENG